MNFKINYSSENNKIDVAWNDNGVDEHSICYGFVLLQLFSLS